MGVCECIVTCVAIIVTGMVLTVLIMCVTDKGKEYIDKENEKEEEKTEEQVLTDRNFLTK